MGHNRRHPRDFVTCKHCGKKFRSISHFHLRARHGYSYDDEHPILDYKAEFDLRFAMSPSTRRKISDAKEIF